jgi:hypothetical protein
MPFSAAVEPPAVTGLNWLAIGLIFAIGAAYQLANPTIADVSWLFVVDEKILAGARLYTDVVEVNPPMSPMLYMPAVLLQHLTGVSAEILQVLITLAVAAGSLVLTGLIMARSGRPGEIARFVMMAAFMLVVAPMFTFSEREHFALMLVLPSLMIIIARAGGHEMGRCMRVVAGLGAGIAVCIKPHFAAALVLPSLYLAIHRRSPRTVFVLENGVAASVAFAYAALVLVFFRSYLTDILPMLLDTYRSFNHPLVDMLLNPAFLIAIGVAVASIIILGCDAPSPRVLVPLLAALGFSVAFIEQGKAWIYHLYPMLGLVFIVFLVEALPRIADRLAGPEKLSPRSISSALLGAAVLLGFLHLTGLLKERNWATIEIAQRITKTFSHPRILTISSDLSIGHPLTRMVGGTWVGTFGCQFVSTTATMLSQAPGASAATRARMAAWVARDREYLAHDLGEGQPDVVLVDPKSFPWDELLASDTEAARLLHGYRQIAEINHIHVLVPRERVAEVLAKGAFVR